MEWFKLKNVALIIGLTSLLAVFPRSSFSTVSNTVVSTTSGYGNGIQTNFSITFDFRDNSWIVVTQYDTSTSPTTVTNIPNGSGAGKFTISGGNPGTTVVMGTAPTSSQYIVITRSIPLTQSTAFSAGTIFPYQGLSSQLDKMTLELQNLNASSSSSGTSIPTGVGYNLLGWNAGGSTLVNYGGNSLVNGDILQFNGSSWVPYLLNSSSLISTINSGGTAIQSAVGGTNTTSNSGTFIWGSHNLTLNLSGDSSLTLPTSGTLVAGVTSTSNVAGDIVLRDGSGNFSSNVITANSFVGPVTGSVIGNVTGNISGTSSNITGVAAIGHGGTGQTTQQSAINALLNSSSASANQVCRYDGANVSLSNLLTADLPSNIPWSKMAQQTHNSLLWSDNSGNEGVIPTNVNAGYVLTSNGVSPYWAPGGSGIPGIFPYGADTGSTNAYVVATPNPPISAYTVGIGVSFVATNTNTAASTVNVSGLGPVAITNSDLSALTANEIKSGQMVIIQYDGTEFQLIGGGFASPMTTLGDLLYENSTPTAARVAGNTSATKKFLSQTGTGTISAAPVWAQPACADLSNAVASCSTDTTNASNISSGTLGLARGGTNADLSATGGVHRVLQQSSVGAAVTVAQLAFTDISGTASAAQLPLPSSSTLGGIESYVAVSHQWINAISTSGVPSSTQPSCSDISGVAASCSTDATNAANISSGILPLARINTVTATRASPTNVTAGGGITVTATVPLQTQFVQGSSGAVTVTANPQISVGNTVGQVLYLVGRSDTNTLTLSDGTGLSLNGGITLYADSSLTLMWDGTNWTELSRRP